MHRSITPSDLNFDRQHIWHPYSSITNPLPCYPVESADGVYLNLTDGTRLIDGMSSWWTAIHGYNVKAINDAIRNQLEAMSHVMFGGITHSPAITLCQKLIELTPEKLQKVFLADSGSVAVEVAMKMAVQYWLGQGNKKRHKFLTIRRGYYGDTLNTMSVCDPENGMHKHWSGFLPIQYFANGPSSRFEDSYNSADSHQLKQTLLKNKEHIAAIILEPTAQNVGGLWFYHPQFLRDVKTLCDEHNILLIFDEIATGFGRTGKLFALEHAAVAPDILCIGKALTGGYMTLSAVLTSNDVAQTICTGDFGTIMHGPTFMGNPLACTAANSSISLLLNTPWQQRVARINKELREGLEPCRSHPMVNDVRVLGAIGVVEAKHPVNVAEAQKHFVKSGVWIRPFGSFLYLIPPYITQTNEIRTLCHAIRTVLDIQSIFN